MLYEPSEIRASEKAAANSRGCSDLVRAICTPIEDLELAMSLDPRRRQEGKDWIDPKLAVVYVIGNQANNLCKIGYSRELRKRVLTIQGSCPIPIVLHHFVYVVGALVAKVVEAEVHECLGEERQHGEWFNVTPEYASAMIHTVIAERGYVWWDEKGRRELGYRAGRIHQSDWARYSRRGNAHA
jgi:hypothetical protein